MSTSYRPPAVSRIPGPRLIVRRRLAPLHALLPLLRWLGLTGLTVALVIAGIRWLTIPASVGALEFTPHLISDGGAEGVLGIEKFDSDGDGDDDILTAGLDGLKLYENQGKLKFVVHVIDDAIDGERIQLTDIDNDGAQDILLTAKNTAAVRWYRHEGGFSYNGTTIVASGSNPAAYAGDLDKDGDPDVVAARELAGNVILSRYMNTGGNFTETVLDSNSAVTAVTLADIDANEYLDIVTGGINGLQRWKTTDGVTFVEQDIDDSNDNRSHIVVTDSLDERTFIVTGDMSEDTVAIYRTDNGIDFGRIQLEGDADAATVRPIDLDGDGDLDVLVAAQDDNEVVWYENNGQDVWSERTLAADLQSVFGVAAADFDKDGDSDVVAADHFRGNLFVYERIRVRPEATQPTDIVQSTTGSGLVNFTATVSDGDLDPTRLRVQYSRDGVAWDKPWLTKVTASAGSVDLKNSNGYQVGTNNAIDTNAHESVTLTFTWDTKSIQNTGGPLVGDNGRVQIRILPRDSRSVGVHAVSGKFRVDNQGPQGITSLRLGGSDTDQITLEWDRARDSSGISYQVYYGTNQTEVLEQRSAVWDSTNDAGLGDVEATSTTITGLKARTSYTFKLVARDDFGNSSTSQSVRGTTSATGSSAPDPTPTFESEPIGPFEPEATPGVAPDASPIPSLQIITSPQPTASPTPTTVFINSPEPRVPSVLRDNLAPVADAGADHVVNPSALVILDGTASTDSDQDSLLFSWRQIVGPKVDITSARTATPSFSAGNEHETYIFALTVRDSNGAIATDTVTVATKALPAAEQTPVDVVAAPVVTPQNTTRPTAPVPPLVSTLLHPANLILFGLSVLSTLILVLERILHALWQRRGNGSVTAVQSEGREPKGKVLHYRTGQPIAGAQVLVYGNDGKLRATLRTNNQGIFPTFFPAGQYTLGVQAEGFTFAGSAARSLAPDGGMLYTGGSLTVKEANKALSLVLPMKPMAGEVSSLKIRVLHLWQTIQHLGRVLSWPIFLAGALLNTVLVFMSPRPLYLIIEVVYIVLVIVKIALEVRVRPAYGQVRDAITHVPLDLAVVRLFEQSSNRLVMTRVTNTQGKFFALPPAGKYTVTIAKPGYATFSKQDVELKSEHDTTLQLTADLMPVAPQSGGLQHARASVL